MGVIGAGAMGTTLASVLGRLVPVVIVCRNPARAETLFRIGARVHGAVECASRPIVVSRVEDLARIGGVSAVFVATKTTAIDEVAAEMAPLMSELGDQPDAPYTISFQNGIEPGKRLMERLGDPRVLRMVLNFGARLDKDGAAETTLYTPPHLIGRQDRTYAAVSDSLASTLTACGFETRAVDDVEPFVWMKGIVNAAMNPVAALTDASVGETLDAPARVIVERLLAEGVMVAKAEGIDLGDDPVSKMMAVFESARLHTPSMVEDIRAGRESEVGQLNRQILEHARRVGVETPTHELITALIDAFDWRVFHRGEERA
ncbi:MAG: 2-dehydropantoate 2-reductase [Phycisphaerales bacterium]|nr:MAG: 2-dehydropantoate 2-reductase [Phycisphaerales bacterium]